MKKTTLLISCATVFSLLLGATETSPLHASKANTHKISADDLKDAVDEVLDDLNKIAIDVKSHHADPIEKLDEYKGKILKNFGDSESLLSIYKDIFNWVVSLGVTDHMFIKKHLEVPIDEKKYLELNTLYEERLSNSTAADFINHLAVLVRELHMSAGHVEHASTALEFDEASSTVASEFSALGVKNFHQTNFDSTCLLLSSLYAIQQKPKLFAMFNTHVLANIRKDKDGNYILKLPSGSYQVYNKDRSLQYPDSRLHTDFPILIKVLSFYVAEAMQFLGHLREVESFTISDIEGKDYFFGKPVGALGLTARVEEGTQSLSPSDKQVILKKDGSLIFSDNGKDYHVTGDFFVSGGTKMGVGGHAFSIHYNGHTWLLYDNLKENVQTLTNSNMPTNRTSFYVVGDYKIQ
ncbi:MAG: hypothetical protein ACTHJ4_00170 [Candidatus Nucleicultricaceae bacterium]